MKRRGTGDVHATYLKEMEFQMVGATGIEPVTLRV